ncbi:hypothetical protein AX16_007023 [Volvariella volvacea WC 439]|nr:hypothetical protein AX16_007023 [Volvariella volvacea WC 439]
MVMLYMALTDQPDDVVSHTIPVYLAPGDHLVAHVVSSFARNFRYAPLSALGVLEVTDIVLLTPDPEYIGSNVSKANATLRFVHQDDVQKLQVEEEFMEDTVFAGLSKLGGLWTALNGLFVLLFGTSLLMAIGSKPLSTFGFAHQFARGKVQERWKARYPQIEQDLRKYQDSNHKGLHRFVLDHFLDIEYFDESKDPNPDEKTEEQRDANNPAQSQTQSDVPKTTVVPAQATRSADSHTNQDQDQLDAADTRLDMESLPRKAGDEETERLMSLSCSPTDNWN